jgi:hypothetical protein
MSGWKHLLYSLCLFLCVSGCVRSSAGQWKEIPADSALTDWRRAYSTNWQTGLDPQIGIQRARSGDVSVVDAPALPGGKAVRVAIDRDEDFTQVANGSPRAEIIFPDAVKFTLGREYLVQWSTYLPVGFEFDPAQQLVVTQIHQGSLSGPPPIALTLHGGAYEFSVRGGEHAKSRGSRICCAAGDMGKWVHWTLHYIPDASGMGAVTQLWKNRTLVSSATGEANAYPDDKPAYLKMGLYKYRWRLDPSNVDTMVILYGPVSVDERGAYQNEIR